MAIQHRSATTTPFPGTPACPQKLNMKNTDILALNYRYEPGRHPGLDSRLESYSRAYGTIWSPHLLGPNLISFAAFVRLPEVIDRLPIGSDQRLALEDLQKLSCFSLNRNTSKRALTDYIKQAPLFTEHNRGYRHVQRVLNTIWHQYEGLLAAKDVNRKAAISAKRNASRRDERRLADAARKAASRAKTPDVIAEIKQTKKERLRVQANKYRLDAIKLQASAKQKLARATTLNAKADLKEVEATKL